MLQKKLIICLTDFYQNRNRFYNHKQGGILMLQTKKNIKLQVHRNWNISLLLNIYNEARWMGITSGEFLGKCSYWKEMFSCLLNGVNEIWYLS